MQRTARQGGQLGPLATPESFGRYQLVERVGVGGMAEVFRATTSWAAGVSKEVCIKRILPPLSGDAQLREMFIQEARIAASLTHANIVPVYEFGIIDDYYFLSMEYVDGPTLRDVMMEATRKNAWPDLATALHLATEVLEGLDYAHRRRDAEGNPLAIIHRDITPGNVMMSRAGEVKILDFGIALIAAQEEEGAEPGRPGAKGKPGYMAPEQAVGMAADGRADIFGLGVVLWELLTHRRLFREKSAAERLRRTAPLPAPSTANPDLPAQLDPIIMRALEAKPADRYETAARWRDALSDYMHARGLRAGRTQVAAAVRRLFDDAAAITPRPPSWRMDIRELSGDSLELVRPPQEQRVTRTHRAVASLGQDRLDAAIAEARRSRTYVALLAAALGLVVLGALLYVFVGSR